MLPADTFWFSAASWYSAGEPQISPVITRGRWRHFAMKSISPFGPGQTASTATATPRRVRLGFDLVA